MHQWDEQPLLSHEDKLDSLLPTPATTATARNHHKRAKSGYTTTYKRWSRWTLSSQPSKTFLFGLIAALTVLLVLTAHAALGPSIRRDTQSPSREQVQVIADSELDTLSHQHPSGSSRSAVLQALNQNWNRLEDGFGVGSVDLQQYRLQLQQTIVNMFPQQEKGKLASLPAQLGQLVECHLSDQQGIGKDQVQGAHKPMTPSQCDTRNMTIPQDMYATAEFVSPLPPALDEWARMNPQSTMHAFDDAQLDTWVTDNFAGASSGEEAASGDVAETWWRLLPRDTLPILKYDLWRLLVLALQGGVYTDADTTPLQPISAWPTGVVDLTPAGLQLGVQGQASNDGLANEGDTNGPSLVVGIEWTSENLQRNKYNPLHDRRVGVVQWTFGAAPGHPVILDSIRRVIEHTRRVVQESNMKRSSQHRDLEGPNDTVPVKVDNDDAHSDLEETEEQARSENALSFDPTEARAVLEWTGPAVLTDSVARYLRTVYGTSLASAAQYPHPIRIGDVLVLPLTALHARQSRWAQALDWALGRGWAPWTVLEGEKDGGGLQGLVAHEHAASWWRQTMDGGNGNGDDIAK